MDKIIYLPTIVIAIFFILIYAIQCYKKKEEFEFSIMTNLVLQSAGVLCGVILIGSTVCDELREVLKNLDLYIFIAGLNVFAVSIKGIHNDVFSN